MKTKQPQLGQKIQELRKANGLTQEELVARCNINVRTIQRIEAGEVTPRPHTIRVIFEALQYEFPSSDSGGGFFPDEEADGRWIKAGVFAGAIYLVFSFVEAYLEFQLLSEPNGVVSSLFYTLVKIGVGIFFAGYMYGFFSLGRNHANSWVKLLSMLMAGATFLSLGVD